MKDLKEQIEVMTHFLNGGEVEFKNTDTDWENAKTPNWDWSYHDYRIKEQKKTIVIEKWLVEFPDNECRIIETSDVEALCCRKIKLLETYEVKI